MCIHFYWKLPIFKGRNEKTHTITLDGGTGVRYLVIPCPQLPEWTLRFSNMFYFISFYLTNIFLKNIWKYFWKIFWKYLKYFWKYFFFLRWGTGARDLYFRNISKKYFSIFYKISYNSYFLILKGEFLYKPKFSEDSENFLSRRWKQTKRKGLMLYKNSSFAFFLPFSRITFLFSNIFFWIMIRKYKY